MRWMSWLLVVAAASCRPSGDGDWVKLTRSSDATAPTISIAGVVRHVELEGGFFAIRGDDSVTYDPINLPDSFRQDGLRVEAVVRRRDDMISTRQVGPIVELERIRAR